MSQPSRRNRLFLSLAVLGLLAAASAGIIYYKGRSGVPAQPPADGAAATGPVAKASTGGQPASGSPDQKGSSEQKAPVPVSVASLATGPVSSYITSTANLVTENEVKVLAESEGRLAELLVEEGERVDKGQALASLAREDA